MRASLWGKDHEEVDRIASAAAGDRVGLAITRGRYPKAYGYEDPNEDVVAAVAGPRATLLVCADGHHGRTSSHVAVRSLLEALGDDPPPALTDDEWLDLFQAANEAVVAAKAVLERHPASETVLIAALATPEALSFAAVGDGALVAGPAGAARARQLNRETMRFVGGQAGRRSLKASVQRGSVPLAPDDWVVLVTDGLSEFIAPLRPADVVPRVIAQSGPGTAEEAAVALVDAACAAGAGDNVATAVLAPPA